MGGLDGGWAVGETAGGCALNNVSIHPHWCSAPWRTPCRPTPCYVTLCGRRRSESEMVYDSEGSGQHQRGELTGRRAAAAMSDGRTYSLRLAWRWDANAPPVSARTRHSLVDGQDGRPGYCLCPSTLPDDLSDTSQAGANNIWRVQALFVWVDKRTGRTQRTD